MIIRLFTEADASTLRQLYHDTIHAINARDYSQDHLTIWAPATYDPAEWLNTFKDNICFVAEINGTIVGFTDTTPSGYLERFFVHKDYQGRGAGSALIKAVITEITNRGGSEILTQASITAKPFFEHYGFELMEEQQETVGDLIFINYLMCKILN